MKAFSDGKQTFIISSGPLKESDCIATMEKTYRHKAKLLAAAPELLEACKELYRILKEDENYLPYNPKIKQAEQAINKAG